MPCVGVIAKVSHPRAPELVGGLLPWLKARQCEFRVEAETAHGLRLALPETQVVAKHSLAAQCDPVVVFGGDGTLISVARHPAPTPSTILGVNLGTLGFLTEIDIEHLYPVLQAVLDGSAPREQRFLLQANVVRAGAEILSSYAINDVVITKEALARIVALDLHINGQFAATIRGDGVIVATPAGSTAYSLASGGSIVHPQVQALLVTPICPHSLTSRPLLLPQHFHVTLQLTRRRGPNEKVFLTIDGQQGFPLEPEDSVSVTTSDSSVYFAKSSSSNYFELLAAKLKWAAR